jgi:Tfp pilus assembly protein PilW
MFPVPDIKQHRSTWLLIALLLVSLLTAAGHQHETDDPHPLSQCAVCLQLQSAQFALSSAIPLFALAIEALPKSHTHAITLMSSASAYQSRAPPRI